MSTSLVKLYFQTPVHFGGGRLSGAKYKCGADTLFSALFLEALAQGIAADLLQAVRAGELLVTDLFPWIKDTFYLPKPRYAAPQINREDDKQSSSSVEKKAFKKLEFIPKDSYPAFFAGTLEAPRTLKTFKSAIGKDALATKVNLLRLDRDEAEPYHVGSFYFGVNDSGSAAAGLYFLVKGGFDIKPLLETLAYSGLGGKRSTGYGRFTYELQPADDFLTGLAPDGSSVLLSCAAPKEEELSEELLLDASYALKKRAGFVQSATYADNPLKKRDFYVFDVGSVFKTIFAGDVFDVSGGGSHPVWRYAKAFWLEG